MSFEACSVKNAFFFLMEKKDIDKITVPRYGRNLSNRVHPPATVEYRVNGTNTSSQHMCMYSPDNMYVIPTRMNGIFFSDL